MTNFFRQVFTDNRSSRSEMLRTLWRMYPQASPADIRGKLVAAGHKCSDKLVLKTRQQVLSQSNTVPAEYTLDELRAVGEAAERLGGIMRLATLVTLLVEFKSAIDGKTHCRE